MDVLFLISAGKLFHNFGSWTENALSKKVECDLGMCSKSRTVNLVCLSWCSETYVSIEEIYSGASPVMLLYTMRQVWFWTSFGNGSQFSSLKSCSEGVMKSAFKIKTSTIVLIQWYSRELSKARKLLPPTIFEAYQNLWQIPDWSQFPGTTTSISPVQRELTLLRLTTDGWQEPEGKNQVKGCLLLNDKP